MRLNITNLSSMLELSVGVREVPNRSQGIGKLGSQFLSSLSFAPAFTLSTHVLQGGQSWGRIEMCTSVS